MWLREVVKIVIALAVAAAFIGLAQERSNVKHTPAPDTDPRSGAEMYRAYCAVCHGLDGKGAGPAAAALCQEIPDLTQLSRKNGGKFPMFHVSGIIQGDAEIAAHGSKDMPMWGDVFRELKRDDSVVKLRVHNLAEYLASLQEK